MLPQDRARYAPVERTLKDGRALTLRLLEPTDTEELTRFYESVPPEDFRFYRAQPLTREMARKMAEERADTVNLVCLVGVDAAAGGRIAGYAWYDWKEPQAPMSTFGICVRRGYQDGGMGRILMERLLEIAREVGPPIMNLTVQKANPRAVALYQKMGFAIVREQMRGPSPIFEPEPEYYMEQPVR